MPPNNYVAIRIDKSLAATISEEVFSRLLPIPSNVRTSREMRAFWQDQLLAAGWVKNYPVGRSHLRIGYFRDKLGLCIQLGNTSRVYADLIKMQNLFNLEDIELGILAVPSDEYSAYLGTNYAGFSRAEKDISALDATITMPIVLLEVDNRRKIQ